MTMLFVILLFTFAFCYEKLCMVSSVLNALTVLCFTSLINDHFSFSTRLSFSLMSLHWTSFGACWVYCLRFLYDAIADINASLWPHSRHKIFYGGIGAPYFYVLYYDILANNEFCYFNSIIVCFFRQRIFYYFCILIVFYDCFQLIIIKGFYQLACWPSYTCYQEWVTSFLLLIL